MTDESRGRDFHDQLLAQLPGAEHAEDVSHHVAAGRAIRIALDECDHLGATDDYNAWSAAAGYPLIQFLGRERDGGLIVDVHNVVIRLSRAGVITVVADMRK